MNRPRLLIAADIYPPDIGGPATYAAKLYTHLQSQWDVAVLCYADAPHSDAVTVLRRAPALIRYINYFTKVFRLARRADVVYAMGPVSAGLPVCLACLLLRKKYIVKVVGDYAWEQAQNSGSTTLLLDAFQADAVRGKIKILRFAQRLVCRRAAKVITPSAYLKRIVTGWGVVPEKIEVIYNATNILPNALEAQRTVGRIVSIGRLVPWKGFETLIRVFERIRKTYTQAELYILGDGPLKKALVEYIASHGLDACVHVVRVDHDERDRLLRSAELFVLNTGYEGLPHVVLEAMAAGVPVLTTNVGGNPEVVFDRQNGVLIPYNDYDALYEACMDCLQNPQRMRQYAQQAYHAVARYDVTAMLKRTQESIQSVIAQS